MDPSPHCLSVSLTAVAFRICRQIRNNMKETKKERKTKFINGRCCIMWVSMWTVKSGRGLFSFSGVIQFYFGKQECIPVGCVPPVHWPSGGGLPAGGVPAWGGVPPRGCTCRGDLLGGCTCQGGVPARGGDLPGGVPTQGIPGQGGVPAQVPPPPVNRMTDKCKNITLPQTSFAGGKKLPELACSTLNARPPEKSWIREFLPSTYQTDNRFVRLICQKRNLLFSACSPNFSFSSTNFLPHKHLQVPFHTN